MTDDPPQGNQSGREVKNDMGNKRNVIPVKFIELNLTSSDEDNEMIHSRQYKIESNISSPYKSPDEEPSLQPVNSRGEPEAGPYLRKKYSRRADIELNVRVERGRRQFPTLGGQ